MEAFRLAIAFTIQTCVQLAMDMPSIVERIGKELFSGSFRPISVVLQVAHLSEFVLICHLYAIGRSYQQAGEGWCSFGWRVSNLVGHCSGCSSRICVQSARGVKVLHVSFGGVAWICCICLPESSMSAEAYPRLLGPGEFGRLRVAGCDCRGKAYRPDR